MAIPFLLGLAAKGAIVAGVASGAAGAKKMKDSKDIISTSEWRYENAKEKYEVVQDKTMKELDKLGKLKLNIWEDFNRFIVAFEKIKNKPEFIRVEEGEYNLNSIELKEIKGVSITAVEVLKSGALSAGAGAAIGMATYSGVMAFGAASTGTAIAGLSGAAATNATLAWLGGGSLAAGGGGMAAGSMLLGTVVAASAALIGGFFLGAKGKESKEKAYEIRREVDKILDKFIEAKIYLKDLEKLSESMRGELERLRLKYLDEVRVLEYIVDSSNDYNKFSEKDKIVLDNNIKLVMILKSLTDIELTKKSLDEKSMDELNSIEVKTAIQKSKVQFNI